MLTKKIILHLALISALASCIPDPKIPADVIDMKTMAKILADVHLTEAKVNRLTFNDYDSTRVAYVELERRIMAKYKVDTAQYKNSYKFYVKNPGLMVKVYDETLNILDERKQKKQIKTD
ncbi:DUF4296 domain-containing protein [Emticicia sp. 21SJ11W-3]|uniref:DUF4296 domain-containing protein n=1 Tax=Emticicia sp. 21SJ11W-3 TaxID=2916755 RepID=UPI00209F2442|nr:DUF4296 domain-containing protein [Emticicia sp. 21SJ11W-3]UTA67473.1 DUF4296 domain-containing protein [Emticicia sp. 21SJ11W-3]